MLYPFNSMNVTSHEVNVTPRTPMYRLVRIELFRELMQRTGTGGPVTIRQLAAAAGVPHGTVGNLLTGEQETVPEPTAIALAQRVGVDLLVVFEPVCRSTSTVTEYAALVRADEEQTA
jgi:transcriptional regulator with XRE-family HTH domain